MLKEVQKEHLGITWNAHICKHIHTRTNTHTHTYGSSLTTLTIYTRIRIYMHTHIHVLIHIYTYTYTYTCTYICMLQEVHEEHLSMNRMASLPIDWHTQMYNKIQRINDEHDTESFKMMQQKVIFVYICMCAYTHTRTHVRARTCTRAHTHTHTYTHTCMLSLSHTHTQTHTHTQPHMCVWRMCVAATHAHAPRTFSAQSTNTNWVFQKDVVKGNKQKNSQWANIYRYRLMYTRIESSAGKSRELERTQHINMTDKTVLCETRWGPERGDISGSWHTAHCNAQQHTAPQGKRGAGDAMMQLNSLQLTVTHCNTLQHTATHCNTLQHTATRFNTLQHKRS